MVGVNKFRLEREPYKVPIFRPNRESPEIQIEKLKKFKRGRDNDRVAQVLQRLGEVSGSEANVMPAVMEAVKVYATVGEISNVWRTVYGVWSSPMMF